jgi:hypothetical protein
VRDPIITRSLLERDDVDALEIHTSGRLLFHLLSCHQFLIMYWHVKVYSNEFCTLMPLLCLDLFPALV